MLRFLHFPINSAISLMDLQADGRAVEVSVVGKEGCVGFTAVLGYANAPGRFIVQVGGAAVRIAVSSLLPILGSMPVLHKVLVRFSALMFREAVISVGCSQFHSVEQKLGRWLLSHAHRTGLTTFPFTHDFLAEQLGVQRVTVSGTLADFKEQGLVAYRYGKIELKDARGMERVSCECFAIAKEAIHHFLKDIKTYRRHTLRSTLQSVRASV